MSLGDCSFLRISSEAAIRKLTISAAPQTSGSSRKHFIAQALFSRLLRHLLLVLHRVFESGVVHSGFCSVDAGAVLRLPHGGDVSSVLVRGVLKGRDFPFLLRTPP